MLSVIIIVATGDGVTHDRAARAHGPAGRAGTADQRTRGLPHGRGRPAARGAPRPEVHARAARRPPCPACRREHARRVGAHAIAIEHETAKGLGALTTHNALDILLNNLIPGYLPLV